MNFPYIASRLARSRRSTAFALMGLALVACGEQSDRFDDAISLLPTPVVLHDTLVFVDTLGHRALLLDASADRPAANAKQVALPYGPTHAEQRHGKEQALVLCAGLRSTATADAEPAALAVVSRQGEVTSYELGTTPFDTLVQSDDGRYAALFRTGTNGDRLLNNANELVIVDLDKKPSEKLAVTHKTPPSFGHTLKTALFSPEMRIAEEDRRLLIVLSAAEVTIIDLNHLDGRRETTVQIGGDENRNIDPAQVLFGVGEPTLYIRGNGSDDIFVFRLEPQENPGGNDFRPTINELGGGLAPRDIALFGEPQDPRLLIAAQNSAQAIIVDPSSSKSTSIALPIAVNRVLLYEASSPTDSEQRPRALIWGNGGTSVAFLDLDDVEDRRARNLEMLRLDNPISSTIPLLDQDKVVLVHQGSGMSLLDLAQRTAAPITSTADLGNALFDATASRLWVGPSGQSRIDTLDLESGKTDELLLDAPIAELVSLFDIGKLAAVHASSVGYVTLIDAAHPGRENAASVRGFLIADLLDRGEP